MCLDFVRELKKFELLFRIGVYLHTFIIEY